MDSEHPFEEQDLRIADLVEREGRALVIGISKWDLKARQSGAISKLQEEADENLSQVKGVPVIGVSGMTGEGIDRLMEAVLDIHEVWNKRVTTNELNRWLEEVLSAHPPPAVSGRRIRLNYITQPKARPPSFVLFCSRADAIPRSYLRYLINSLRETFDLLARRAGRRDAEGIEHHVSPETLALFEAFVAERQRTARATALREPQKR